MGPEFVGGVDIPRTWATAAQAFVNPIYSLVVFREQNILPPLSEGGQMTAAVKNVASIVLPTPVLLEFYQNLGVALQGMEIVGVPDNGEPAQ